MDKAKERSALNLLRLICEETDCVGVAVSFGKDPLATLDLCCRIFKRVEGYYLFRVSNLEIVKGWAKEVFEHRYGITVRMYPHFDLFRCYKYAVYPHWKGLDKVPKVDWLNIENCFRRDAKIDWIPMAGDGMIPSVGH